MMTTVPPHKHDAFRLYKANAPFAGQQCFSDYLNENLAMGVALMEPWASKARELDLLIGRSKLSEDTTLYRATLDGYVARHISNGELMYPAFMSTTNDRLSIERHFSTPFRDISGALLKIECPEGTPALDMETDPSFGGHERELLLPRNSRFELVEITETFDRQLMAEVMSDFYASSYSSLKTYTLRYKL